MGAWGYKALESDEGLDVVDFLEKYLGGRAELKLSDFIASLTENGFFTESGDIDFWYDHTALAVSELYFGFADNGGFTYDVEEEVNPFKLVKSFTADGKSLKVLLDMLYDIKNEVPDEDGEREIVELWKDSLVWEDWSAHLDSLIKRLETEIK